MSEIPFKQIVMLIKKNFDRVDDNLHNFEKRLNVLEFEINKLKTAMMSVEAYLAGASGFEEEKKEENKDGGEDMSLREKV